jgi:hypothetical protein
MSIDVLLNDIRQGELVLPDLQRDFVWKDDQIRLLLDSILRGYPFGALLLWNTQHLEVPYRKFAEQYRQGMTFDPRMKPAGKPMRMVLDGQQRLQSLYLAVDGTYEGKALYFNITSGPDGVPDPEDEEGVGQNFRFAFWGDNEPKRPKRFVRVSDIASWGPRDSEDEIDRVVADASLSPAEGKVAARNMRLLREYLTKGDLVPVETIDEGARNASQARTIDEILEIFVRVNSGGTKLTRSDLMFSLIKTKWQGARSAFDDLEKRVDPTGTLGINKDFIIRGLLTLADRPPTFEVDSIERHWNEMQRQFEPFSAALEAALDFVQDQDCRIRSASLLDPINSLIPVVYYLSRQRSCSVPAGARKSLRTFLYFMLLNRFVTSDARIRWLRDVLKAYPGEQLPLDQLLAVLPARQRSGQTQTTRELLQWNVRLALNIVQPGVARDTLSWQAKAEVDHVFPQAVYRPKFGDLVDDIGNYAYLGKLQNIRKSKVEPSEYFAQTSDADLMAQYLIEDRSLLEPSRFEEFVAKRRDLIVREAREFLGR